MDNLDESTRKSEQTTMAWIVVLAVAITCCAILFVVFANYLVSINRNLSAANMRLTVMESNESQLLTEIQALHRTMMANQAASKNQAPAALPPPPPVTH